MCSGPLRASAAQKVAFSVLDAPPPRTVPPAYCFSHRVPDLSFVFRVPFLRVLTSEGEQYSSRGTDSWETGQSDDLGQVLRAELTGRLDKGGPP